MNNDPNAATGSWFQRHTSEAPTLDASPPLQTGHGIADAPPGYEILEELGRGGMGVVYKARQIQLDRLVALKMILSGGHAGATELARFRREAEAVAKLQHPNIVQIYEVGENNGRPFFSLEFVDGGSLAAQLDGTPLPPLQAAELLETIARAVQFAHQQGLVHRDLKPANVLMALRREPQTSAESTTAQGPRLREMIPKIADFGLAKRLNDASSQTATGAILGTPSYMAPEQAGGKGKDVGPAADVYALGALLYELITGRPPFKAATPLDTMMQVVNDEPVPPSRLTPKLPRDLETICLKCLEKDPAKRYTSASALADDLQRWRKDEPIQARPANWAERLMKWARRRPAVAALIGVSALATLALIGGGVVYYAHIQRSKTELEDALTDAEREKARAQTHLNRVLQVMDRIMSRVSDERSATRPSIEQRRKLLDEAQEYYQWLITQESADPAVQRETARACYRAGLLHMHLGEGAQAAHLANEAARLQTILVQQFPHEPGYQHDLAETCHLMGLVHFTVARLNESEVQHKKALEISQRLVANFPDRAAFQVTLAHSAMSLATMIGNTRREITEPAKRFADLARQTAEGLVERYSALSS